MSVAVRDYRKTDEENLNRVADLAFAEYSGHFDDWQALHGEWSRMSDLAELGQIVVATDNERVVGGVCYVAAHGHRLPCLEPEWAIIRSLVVDPGYRGRGIGTMLAQTCVDKAIQDRCETIGLVTTPVMAQAVKIYERLGFAKVRDAGKAHGVRWLVYCKPLRACQTNGRP